MADESQEKKFTLEELMVSTLAMTDALGSRLGQRDLRRHESDTRQQRVLEPLRGHLADVVVGRHSRRFVIRSGGHAVTRFTVRNAAPRVVTVALDAGLWSKQYC
jgi:hypothetical protein